MDLVDEILKFSSVLQDHEEDPLKEGLRFYLVDDVLTPPAYDDTESNTTVDGLDIADTLKSTSRKDSADELDPGTPSSQATVSTRVQVEGWPAQRKELELEVERLSMWKYDVQDQGVDPMFKDNNALNTIIRRALVNIAQTLVGLLKPDFTSPVSQLGKAYQRLQDKLEEHRILNSSRPLDEAGRPYSRTRSRQNSIGASNDDRDVLGDLRDNIDRVEYMLNGIPLMNTTTTLGKRARRESSLDGGDSQLDRKKLYNGPNLVSQPSEELEEVFHALEHGLSELNSLWDITTALFDSQPHGKSSNRVTTTLTLGDEVGRVSALLDFAVSRDSSVTHMRSTTRNTMGKLALSTSDESFQMNKALDPVGLRICGSLKYLALAIRICELLRCLPEWQVQVCPEISSLTDFVVKSIWMSLLEELLGSLRQILQHILESGCPSEPCISDYQLTLLQELFEGYSQTPTRPRLERLVASRRTSGSLRNLHQAAANAISSLCGTSNNLDKTIAKEADTKGNVHQAMAGFDEVRREPNTTCSTSSSRSFTICTTKYGNNEALEQSSLDDFLNRPLL